MKASDWLLLVGLGLIAWAVSYGAALAWGPRPEPPPPPPVEEPPACLEALEAAQAEQAALEDRTARIRERLDAAVTGGPDTDLP